MTELDAVNLILPYLGEHTVTRVEGSRHGSVGIITSALERKRKALLTRKWWFNSFTRSIPPNSDGRIQVPEDTLTVYRHNTGIQGEYFYDTTTGSQYFNTVIEVDVVMDFEFDKLPHYAQEYIAYDAAIEVTVADLGMEDQIQILMQYRATASKYLEREHLRNMRFNSRNSVSRRHSRIGRYR